MRVGGYYIVKIYLDEQTGRVAATEKIEPFLSNEYLTVKEQEPVNLMVYRRTDIGYAVIINNSAYRRFALQRYFSGNTGGRYAERVYQEYSRGKQDRCSHWKNGLQAGRR